MMNDDIQVSAFLENLSEFERNVKPKVSTGELCSKIKVLN